MPKNCSGPASESSPASSASAADSASATGGVPGGAGGVQPRRVLGSGGAEGGRGLPRGCRVPQRRPGPPRCSFGCTVLCNTVTKSTLSSSSCL
uniref:Uncharacterized protein n=1 Tax=Arundo donax TaxID=35708 RepID=A0A0A9FPL5_ARUDO